MIARFDSSDIWDSNQGEFVTHRDYEKLAVAARELMNKLAEMEECVDWKVMWAVFWEHGGQYRGPSYKQACVNLYNILPNPKDETK